MEILELIKMNISKKWEWVIGRDIYNIFHLLVINNDFKFFDDVAVDTININKLTGYCIISIILSNPDELNIWVETA